MADRFIIIKDDGKQTSVMNQTKTTNYLINLITKDRHPNLKQSLNDVVRGGNATGDYKFNGHPVMHGSSGTIGVKNVTLFFYILEGVNYIFAMGKHSGSSIYEISDYGQPTGDFQENRKISISARNGPSTPSPTPPNRR